MQKQEKYLKVTEDVWETLFQIKLRLRMKSVSEVINYLFKKSKVKI